MIVSLHIPDYTTGLVLVHTKYRLEVSLKLHTHTLVIFSELYVYLSCLILLGIFDTTHKAIYKADV